MSTTRPAEAPSALDWLRVILNLALAPALVLLSLSPLWARAEIPADRPTAYIPSVTPASFTFWIAFLIYIGSLAYALYQALPRHRSDPLLRRSGWFTAAAYLGSILWLLAARAQNLGMTVFFILWILMAVIAAYIPTIDRRAVRSAAEHWFVRAHLSVFLGWVAVITVANVAAALVAAGVTTLVLPATLWAIALLGIEAAIAVFVIWVSLGDGVFTLTAIWCFAGIVAANIWREPNPSVALTAGLAAAIVAVAWMIRTSTPDALEQRAAPQIEAKA